MLVLDTAALLFWTLAPERLSDTAERALAEAGDLPISSISLWEIGIKAAKGKLRLPVTVREFSERLSQVDRVNILPVDLETWLTNLELPWNHRDPADRTIVATAKLRGCLLLTSDNAIRDFYSSCVW